MSTLLNVIIVIVFIIVSFIVYRRIAFNKLSKEMVLKKLERVHQLHDRIEKGETLTQRDIYPYAKNILSRTTTFQFLRYYNLTDLFPKEFYTFEKAGESDLANWLEFPTELNACPEEIEYMKRVTIDFDGENHWVHYEVFKFRSNEPHWAAKNGWTLGVVGPYFDDSNPYDKTPSTFSRFGNRFDKTSPEEEVNWVHKNISLRG